MKKHCRKRGKYDEDSYMLDVYVQLYYIDVELTVVSERLSECGRLTRTFYLGWKCEYHPCV